MSDTTEAIRKSAGKLGLMMSFRKTEILTVGPSSSQKPNVPLGDEGNIKVVENFKYLGAYCSADGTNTKELNCRIGKAAGAFKELDTIWKDRYISLPTKMQIYRACVLSTLMYGAECWTLKTRDEERLDAFDMRCQRKILKIKWIQHIKNHDIRLKTSQPQLTRTIRKRRLQWFGHVQRMNNTRLPLKLYRWTPLHGQRKQGRPRTTWKDVIRRDLDTILPGWTVEEAEVAARDRRSWSNFLRQAASADPHGAVW